MENDPQAAYDEVYVYTMGRPGFTLQHVVDAFRVQAADSSTKPIAVVFGLVGLYLHVEKDFSGHQVQAAHIALARKKRAWPAVPLPGNRGGMTIVDVRAASPGPSRDQAIDDWCRCVWNACSATRATIVALLLEHRVIEPPAPPA